ncbi:MAG TPA: hypothetical protein VGR98_02585 [Streptosporangiaceae bacterium]|nr:hypothetical protein [Streptosporangiaceae bacterium]
MRINRLIVAAGIAAGALAMAAVPAAASAAPAQPTSGNLFASITGSGTLAHGNRVTSVTHLSTGRYEVRFATDVRRCAYVATTINAHSQALQVFTAGGHLSENGVYVETKNQGGGLTDGPFNLAVDCGATGWSYAIVGYTANLVRATPGTRLTSLGTGRYDVTFPTSIGNCAYLATVGDPGNHLVFNPNGVYTGSGPNARTVYIETKNPGGGLSPGIPFHLAVICPSAANAKIAVVNASGLPSRGSPLTSSFSSSVGQYTLATGRTLAACAAIATRGSVNTSVPFDPATVEITPGPAPNTAGVQVRGLLFFGGNLASESFHSAMIC